MRLSSAINEVGILEIYSKIEVYRNCEKVLIDASEHLPISSEIHVLDKIADAVDMLISINKEILFFLTPELILLEELARRRWGGQAICCFSRDMDHEAKERIINNTPDGINIQFLIEGSFPDNFKPTNGAIIAIGVGSANWSMILKSNYRMMALYKEFCGRKILISCFSDMTFQPDSWIAFRTEDLFTDIYKV